MSRARAIAALLFAGVALASAAAPAVAAQPRQLRVIASSSVKLSDLFAGLLPWQDCDIGPGPAPGSRIVVEQPQLAAIAEQFGVDWQPGMVPARVVVERKARVVGHDELVSVIRKALGEGEGLRDPDVELSGDATLMVPAELKGAPRIESLDYDTNTGRFAAGLLFEAPGADSMRIRVLGTAAEMMDVPVPTHVMSAGSIVETSDLQLQRLRKRLVGEGTLLVASDGIGLALRRRAMPGVPLLLNELGRPDLVSRGMMVLLRLDGPGLAITTKGEAIEAGARDDRIHVLNVTSRIVLVARVIGPGTVQVDPQGGPVVVASQRSGLPTAFGLSTLAQSLNQRGLVP